MWSCERSRIFRSKISSQFSNGSAAQSYHSTTTSPAFNATAATNQLAWLPQKNTASWCNVAVSPLKRGFHCHHGPGITRPELVFRVTQQIRFRNMAMANGRKMEWLVVLPDHNGAIQQRLNVRAFESNFLPLVHFLWARAIGGWDPVENIAALVAIALMSRQHIDAVLPLHEQNKIAWGGAMFSHPPAEGEDPPPMVGSALLVYASSKEEVLELIKNDIYTKSGVWNPDKMQIWPFKSAVRSNLSSTQGSYPVQNNV